MIDFLFPELQDRYVLVNSRSQAFAGWTTPTSSDSPSAKPRWVETTRWTGAGYERVQAEVLRMPLERARALAKSLPGRPFVVECPVGQAVPIACEAAAADRFHPSASEQRARSARAVGALFPTVPTSAPARTIRAAPAYTTRAVVPRFAVRDDARGLYLGDGDRWFKSRANAQVFATREEAIAAVKRLAVKHSRIVNLALADVA